MEASFLVLLLQLATAQTFPRGYADPEPVLDAAEKATGVGKLQCVTLSGTGYAGMVGQQRLAEKNVDWPRGDLTHYRRVMNWEARTMKEELDRKPGLNPASWKWGLGWVGGATLQQKPPQRVPANGPGAGSRESEGGIDPAPAPADTWSATPA